MLSHANLSKNVQQIVAWFPGFNQGEITHLGVLPIFHSFGLTCCMNICIWMGWTDVLIPRPEPQVILEAVDKYKVNFFPAVPTMYVGVLNHPKASAVQFDLHQGLLLRRGPPPRGGHQGLRGQDRLPDLRGLRPFGNHPGRHHEPLRRKNQTRVDRTPDAGYGPEDRGSVGRHKGNARGGSRRGPHQGTAGHERILQDARGNRPTPSRTAGFTPATSARWTRRGTSTSWTARRT